MTKFTKVTAKELSFLMGVSYPTALKLHNDIKDHFNVKMVLQQHINQYFNI